ncbi:Cys-tRNA(Pro) deacylase [Terasakiella sp. A23]|uniref:Cys-tRNA(Pro) deacylase n=1 Tax=Terasakiella sp. FCG-A23 TaxID=3080561 RepID=UPI002955035F|nr:Cys-tRNA(Pro) deacylase [Terasakiella sp. A23]MDV7340790.1 Cys-tRNA(Pro) deacylase [Terasakiella sp. A23]
MTPAINLAKKKKITFHIHQYEHDPKAESYGEEAAEKLGLSLDQVFKTLVVATEKNDLCVCVVPVAGMLDLKQVAKALKVKKTGMADAKKVQSTTGYVLGGVSPLGQKKQLTTLIDTSAETQNTIFVSAGKRGLEIELSPTDLKDLTRGTFAPIGKA